MRVPKHFLLVSDFNLDNLAAYIRNDRREPVVTCTVAPFGQVAQVLLDPHSPSWSPEPDVLLVWTRPESVLQGFADLLAGFEASRERILEEVDAFAEHLIRASGHVSYIFVPLWVIPPHHSGHGILALSPQLGAARMLLEANLRLLQTLEAHSNIIPLNTSKWIEVTGERSFSPKLWYLGKVPFSNDLFKVAAQDTKAALLGLYGRSRKLIVLDLDDTLWGGIVGDVGAENLTLGGHDPAGEAFVDFQRELKALTRRGIVLAIASKNDESVALNALRTHPEMILRPDDFAAQRINWKDKAQNIVDLVAELRLGLDSVVFLDDSPVERGRVRETLPEVLVPDWPADPRLYSQALLRLDCFDRGPISQEDRRRQAMYMEEGQRNEMRQKIGSVDDWLKTLDLQVKVEALNPGNQVRVAQLLNKTNQMNLRTRRMTEAEYVAWASEENHRVWAFYVADKFGDLGLTGILGVESVRDKANITDFVLSCRAMGRRVEEAMLHVAAGWARNAGLASLNAEYIPSAKNRPCLEFLKRSGLMVEDEHRFFWHTTSDYPLPAAIKLVES